MLLSFGNIAPAVLAAIPAVASALLSGISSLFGSHKQSKEAQKNRDFQSAEARLNRVFNADQAQLSRNFQLEMFNRTNQYNDPSQVVQRLVKAGLHPALAFGGIQGASFGGSAAQASSSASPSGSVADMSGITSMGNNIVAAASQARLASAQADLAESEAAKNYAQLPYIEQKIQLDIEAQKVGISLAKADIDLKTQEGQLIKTSIENTAANTEVLREQKGLVQQQRDLLKQENFWKSIKETQEFKKSVAICDQLFSQAHLNDVQAYRFMSLLGSELALNQSMIRLNQAHTNESNARTDAIEFENLVNYKTLESYGLENLSKNQIAKLEEELKNLAAQTTRTEWAKWTDLVGTAIGSIVGGLTIGGIAKSMFKTVPKIGFKY